MNDRPKITRTKINANTGNTREMIVIKTAITVSIVETIGLAKPAEVAVEANRVALDVLAIAVADPPPAIMANDQVTTGFKSIVVETTMAVPAMAAKGMAMVSNKLSKNGM